MDIPTHRPASPAIERNEWAMAQFDGKEAVVERSGGTINIYYGGFPTPDGFGHGHVKATGGPLGENIVYWRLPDNEGGQEIVSNSWDIQYGNDLRPHLSGF